MNVENLCREEIPQMRKGK